MIKVKVALLGLKDDFSNMPSGGIQRYMFELYQNLHKMNTNIEKVSFKPIKFLGNGPSFTIQTLLKNFKDYNIIHLPMPLLFKNLYIKDKILIKTAHDFRPLLYSQYTFGHKNTLKYKMWIKFIVNTGCRSTLDSDYIISNSSQTRDEAIRLGFDKKRIFITNLGVDKSFTESPIKKQRKKDIFKVGYIGSLAFGKNVEFAIKAGNIISDKKISFEIWGNGSEYEYLNSISENKNIKFKGFASKILNTYDGFDVFVHPSFHEGFGLPIIEAQSRGLPVVIYKYGKIPKEVRKYCFEAENPDHMAQIIEKIKENGYNEKLKKKATEYARGFTWENTAKKTLEVYEKLISING